MPRKQRKETRTAAPGLPKVVAIAAALSLIGSVEAVEIKTDNPDVQIRWDNTVRYNLGVRVEKAGNVANNPNFDEGESKFDQGDVVTNRVDLLTEFDFIYRKSYGFRVSAAGWYDNAYQNGKAERNPDLPPTIAGSYVDDKYSSFTKRFYRGPSGEFLDAFVFGRFDLGEMPLTLKAGQHTVFWGESLGLSGALHGVSYSQMPLDLRKAFATPGVEAKELFLPLNNISGQLLVKDDLAISAQYFLDWDPTRIPEGGTYLGPADFLMYGSDRASATLVNGGVSKPKRNGDWGLSASWSPEWLDGTMGFYYRNFTDKVPSIFVTGTEYREFFGEDIDLLGISLSKQIGGVSVSAELSYRKNMPLTAQTLGLAVAPGALVPVLFPNGAPTLKGNTYQARGETLHAVVNALGVMPATSLFDTASWSAELTYARLQKVTDNRDMFFGEGYGVCDEDRRAALGARFRDKWDQCATKDMFALALRFTPVWLQALPGVDISLPMAISGTLSGNAPTQLGGNEGNGNYSIGVGADIYSKYRVDLTFVDYFGKVKQGAGIVPGTTQVTSANGLSTLLRDRGWVSLTFKTTF